ncbi:MAG: hypothetical protein HFE47_03710 [Clostridia bacterium]|nr:hypothetical protein [Clostridia bacterium]
MKDKIDSLLGFAVKAGKILYGADSLQSAKKNYYVIFVCGTTAENTRKKVFSLAEERRVPILLSENELQYAVSRANCKVLAVTDKQMATAMLAASGENYRVISAEVI